MQKVDFQTSLGIVPIWARFDAFASGRPLLLVIRGLLPQKDHLFSLADRLPEVDVALAHLPGMHCSPLTANSMQSFSRAFDEVINTVGRPVIVLGVSLGGVVTLGLRSPLVARRVALDPPLSSAGLKPLQDQITSFARAAPAATQWLADVCGVVGEQIEARDYRTALAGLSGPACVLVGAVGEQQPGGPLPSLVSAEDLSDYIAHPAISVQRVQGAGHNIPRDATAAMIAAITTAPTDRA